VITICEAARRAGVPHGAEDAALERGYLLITLNPDDHVDRERRALAVLRARQADGVLIVMAPGDTEATHVASAVEAGTAVVCVDPMPDGIAVDSVTVDNRKGALTCIRTASSAAATGAPSVYTAKEMPPEAEPPTAVFASNAVMGFGAWKAPNELGLRCPEDGSLALFDDISSGDAIQPRLTVAAQPAYEMGRLGAELLIARLEGRERTPGPMRVELSPALIVRGSPLRDVDPGPPSMMEGDGDQFGNERFGRRTLDANLARHGHRLHSLFCVPALGLPRL
jgi:LacI family transcriptional regulator